MGNRRIGVLIGRFQGYHSQHHRLLLKAAYENDTVVVILGSHNRRSCTANPFSCEERQDMIEKNIQACPEMKNLDTRILFRYSNDHPDNNVWARNIRCVVNQLKREDDVISLYGCKKDESSFYLEMFPEWEQRFDSMGDRYSATELRAEWYSNIIGERKIQYDPIRHRGNVSETTINWLANYEISEEFKNDMWYAIDEARKFKDYPYPQTLNFCCADAVVICHEHVLMIKRARTPGKGCWALPGGFKNSNECFYETSIRELFEETHLDIDPRFLQQTLPSYQIFDNPGRSDGFIPRITVAFYFDISSLFPDYFPQVAADDDAAECRWIRIKDLEHMRDVFDDHAFIVLANNP